MVPRLPGGAGTVSATKRLGLSRSSEVSLELLVATTLEIKFQLAEHSRGR